MRDGCVSFVDWLGEICVKFIGLFTSLRHTGAAVEKPYGFTALFSRFLHGFFHSDFYFFQPVRGRFLPIFNIANKNNNDIILTFNYWRISG